ncbi:hypothetical protein ACFQWH_09420 [Mycolicibacterium sp. GCM10028919]|uniref:hypothetical protein n=1 Tax=Mycolicibacterium sp. GCM10028919 TaxID=3273401 RepID=UPI00361C16AC
MTHPALRSPQYARGPFRMVRLCELFMSSGSDVDNERQILRDLVEAFNSQAIDARVDFLFNIRAWEDAVTRRTFGDGNREFRYDASIANVVIVLLNRELRKGTEEELDEALASEAVQVAIILMDPPEKSTEIEAEKHLLAKLDEIKDDVRWLKTAKPGHVSVTIAMASILARLVIELASATDEPPTADYNEVR